MEVGAADESKVYDFPELKRLKSYSRKIVAPDDQTKLTDVQQYWSYDELKIRVE